MKEKIIELLRTSPSGYKLLDQSYKNINFTLQLLSEKINVVPYLNENIKENTEVIENSIKLSYCNFYYFKRTPWELQKKSIENNISNIKYISHIIRSKKENKELGILIKNGIINKGQNLIIKDLPKEMKIILEEETIVEKLISNDGLNLEYFKNFQNDKKIILIAIKNNPNSFKYISDDLKKDLEFLKELIMENKEVYEVIPEKKLELSYFVITKIDSKYFFELPRDHQKEKKILFKFLENNKLPDTTYYIDLGDYKELFTEDKYIKLLLKHNGNKFNLMPAKVKEKRKYILIALNSSNCLSLKDIPENFYNDKEILILISKNFNLEVLISEEVRTAEEAFLMEGFPCTHITRNEFKLSEKLSNDYEFMKSIIQNNYKNYEIASDTLKKDKELIKIAISQNPFFINSLSSEFKYNLDLVFLAASINLKTLDGLFINKKNSDTSLFEDVQEFSDDFIDYLEKNKILLDDYFMIILEKFPNSYRYFPIYIRNIEIIAWYAIKDNVENLEYVPFDIKCGDTEMTNYVLEKGVKPSEIDYDTLYYHFMCENIEHNPILMKEFILREYEERPGLWTCISSDKNCFNVTLELLKEIKIQLSDLDINLLQHRKALEVIAENQSFEEIPSWIKEYFFTDKDLVLKIIKNSPKIFFTEKYVSIFIDEDFVLEAIKVNPEILRYYSPNCHFNIDSLFLLGVIQNNPKNYNALFFLLEETTLNEFLTEEIVLAALNIEYSNINGGTDLNEICGFLSFLPAKLKSNINIILEYLRLGGNNLNYFNVSLKEIMANLILSTYSSLSPIKAKALEGKLKNEESYRNDFLSLVAEVFSFPNIVSTELMRVTIEGLKYQFENCMKNTELQNELLVIMKIIILKKPFCSEAFDDINIDDISKDALSNIGEEDINNFIDLIRSILLEDVYQNKITNTLIMNLFPNQKNVNSFKIIRNNIFKDLGIENHYAKKNIENFIKKTFDIKLKLEHYKGIDSNLYLLKNDEVIVFNGTQYDLKQFYQKNGKVIIRNGKNVNLRYHFIECLDYLFEKNYISRERIKKIYLTSINSNV